MSSVRKCDLNSSPECQRIFSELDEGWQAFQSMTVTRGLNGEQVSVPQMLDACPACAVGPTITTAGELAERTVRALEGIEQRLERAELKPVDVEAEAAHETDERVDHDEPTPAA